MIQKENSRLKLPVLAVYLMLFYGIWTLWEFFVKPNIGLVVPNEYLSQFVKSGVIKNLVWTLPAILLIRRFDGDMYVGLKDMFTVKVRWIRYIPVFLLFIAYLIGGAALTKGRIEISEAFGFSDVIIVLFVGITEETVFRGWLLNAMVTEKRKWLPIIINAVLFLLIHFPIWLKEGSFAANFQSFGFVSVLVLSVIFSWTFIRSRSMIVPILLHMLWDLLMLMLY